MKILRLETSYEDLRSDVQAYSWENTAYVNADLSKPIGLSGVGPSPGKYLKDE